MTVPGVKQKAHVNLYLRTVNKSAYILIRLNTKSD